MVPQRPDGNESNGYSTSLAMVELVGALIALGHSIGLHSNKIASNQADPIAVATYNHLVARATMLAATTLIGDTQND